MITHIAFSPHVRTPPFVNGQHDCRKSKISPTLMSNPYLNHCCIYCRQGALAQPCMSWSGRRERLSLSNWITILARCRHSRRESYLSASIRLSSNRLMLSVMQASRASMLSMKFPNAIGARWTFSAKLVSVKKVAG